MGDGRRCFAQLYASLRQYVGFAILRYKRFTDDYGALVLLCHALPKPKAALFLPRVPAMKALGRGHDFGSFRR